MATEEQTSTDFRNPARGRVPEAERNAVFESLKAAVRSRGWTYADLARHVEMSESGIKKIFSQENCSLDRLCQFAAAVDLTLADLTEAAAEAPLEPVHLSAELQASLLARPAVFALYWRVAVEGYRVSHAQHDLSLSDAELRRALSALDDSGLVRVGPGERVRIAPANLTQWHGEGPLLDAVYGEWPKAVIAEARREPASATHALRLVALELTDTTRRELVVALQQLVDEFVRRAHRERSHVPRSARSSQRMIVATAPGSFMSEPMPS